MMAIFVAVFVADVHWNGYLYGVGHGFLNVDWNVFLDVHGVRSIERDFHWVRYRLFYWVGDVLFNRVRGWHGDLDRVGYGFLHMNRVRPVVRDFHGVRHGFFNWIRYMLLHWVGHGLGYMHGVGPVNVDLEGDVDLFVNGVGSRDMHRNLYWVRNFLLNRVRSRDVYFDGYMDFFCYGVWLRNENFDGNRSIDWHMNGVGNLFFHWVGLRNVYGYFNDLLDRVRYVFDDGVGLRYMDLHGEGDSLLYWVGNVLLYRVGYWNILDKRDSFVDLSMVMATVTTTVTTSPTTVTTASVT